MAKRYPEEIENSSPQSLVLLGIDTCGYAHYSYHGLQTSRISVKDTELETIKGKAKQVRTHLRETEWKTLSTYGNRIHNPDSEDTPDKYRYEIRYLKGPGEWTHWIQKSSEEYPLEELFDITGEKLEQIRNREPIQTN